MAKKLILPDTNILILGLANKQPYASYLRSWIKKQQIILSPIVVAEFLVGATTKEEKIFNQLLQKFQILSVDLPTAQLAAKYRKFSLKRKQKLHLPDCLIAAQCKIYNTTLATLNPKDYPQKSISIISKF